MAKDKDKDREDDAAAEATGVALYLVRHAIAAERGPKWPDDTKRPLTHKGAARMRQVVRGLRALGVEVDLVLTSPLVRARQTADILVEGLGSAPTLEVTPALAPEESPSAVAAALGRHASASRIALVGHEPGLGLLAAWLIGAREPFVFKKGGVCRIDVPTLPPGRNGALVWHAAPKMLRALA
jgi:phosphohistidine phosphatase